MPISHDEVVYGKHSLLGKMSGDEDLKFAQTRAFLAYMIAHPGKKLNFMGNEIGQESEWNFKTEIDWSCLANEKNRVFQNFVKELNHFYLSNSPLYQVDFNGEGFSWIYHDDYSKSVIAFRRIDKSGNDLIVLCNFQPMVQEEYHIGVPVYGIYKEVFNTDDTKYGGSGVGNGDKILTDDIALHGCGQSLSVTVPPMSVSFIKLAEKLEKPKPEVPKVKKVPAKKIISRKTVTNKNVTRK